MPSLSPIVSARKGFTLSGTTGEVYSPGKIAAEQPERVLSLTVLSAPHTDAFLIALRDDETQKQLSRYIQFFRAPGRAAEAVFQTDNCARLRQVCQGKVPEATVESNVLRLSAPGALTAVLNWYRALDPDMRIGPVTSPTLFIGGSQDLAVGEAAAENTRAFVTGLTALSASKASLTGW
jgi:pimeloyl-ACP methyl ester carboxylesterase